VQIPVLVSALNRPAFDRTQLCLFIYLAALRLDKMTMTYKKAYAFNKMSIRYIS